MPKTNPRYDKRFVSLIWQIKAKIVVPPESCQAIVILFLRNRNPWQSFFIFFPGKVVFCRDIMLKVAKNRMILEV